MPNRGSMKKGIIVLLITVLAAGMAFAGFNGSASIGFGADLHHKKYGFIDQSTNVSVSLALEQAIGSAQGEGDIVASINGTVSFKFDTGAYGDDEVSKRPVYVYAAIDSAKISGADWSVSILGAGAPNDFAKSAIDSRYVSKGVNDWGYSKGGGYSAYSYSFGYKASDPIPGVKVSYKDYTAGFGINGSYGTEGSKPKVLGYFYTPAYEVAEGLKVNAGFAGYKQGDASTIGGSINVAYAADSLKASVASDMGYDLVAEKFNFDVAAKASLSPVALDVYFRNTATAGYAGENLLSAKAVIDLASFNVPVKLTITGKDVINAQNLSAKAEVAVAEPITVSVNGGYAFKKLSSGSYVDSKTWSAGIDMKYACEQFTAKAGAALSGITEVTKVTANASIESESIIPGATIGLYWADVNDNATGEKTMNLLDKEYGQVYAACEIAF